MSQHTSDFTMALASWKARLSSSGCSSKVVWKFRDQLTIRPRIKAPDGGFVLSYAHEFVDIREQDAERVFEDLRSKKLPIVFQLLVSNPDFSVCTLAFDPWESEEGDFCEQDGVYYSLEDPYSESVAITSKQKWDRHRSTQSKIPSGLDFVASQT
ncbi:hypothetical protein OAF27_02400 [Verrucomicrobiales bacterium]|nr:hypothetical protein [Verrucomicrobiales bacterium]